MRRGVDKIIWPLALVTWTVACLVFFLGWYPYHFHYQAQNQLFLWTGDYVSSYFLKPAWLACLAGDFLTQFYYYRYAGPVILALALGLVGITLRDCLLKAGMKAWAATALAFLVMGMETALSSHYAFLLSSVFSLLGAALLFRLTIGIRRTPPLLHVILLFLLVPLAHWLFGYGALVFVALVIIGACASRQRIMACAIATLLPLACLGVTRRWYLLGTADLYAYPGMGKWRMPSLLLEKALGVECEYQFGNYRRVATMVEEEEDPLTTQVYYHNLVLARQGRLAENLLKQPGNVLGTFYKIGPDSPMWVIQGIDELYWLVGDMTFCERAAMLANVFSPNNRNGAKVKRLAEVNLVTGDTLAARKFLGLLEKTLVYHDWAARLLRGDKDAMKPYLDKRAFVNRKDTLRKTDNARVILIELLDSNPGNTIARDYLLCSDLLAKDISSFWHDYHRYYLPLKGQRPTPVVYQQALCVALASREASHEEWRQLITNQAVYRQFAAYNEERGHPKYKDTYWYYFDKGRVMK